LRVVAKTETLEDALHAMREFLPRIVLIEAPIPATDIPLSCQKLLTQQHDTKIIVLESGPDDRTLIRALSSGASGFLRRYPTPGDLRDCVQTLMSNRIYIGPLQSANRQMGDAGVQPRSESLSILSDREIEVLTLLADGLKSRQIAVSLHISEKTVETHRGHIMQKLNIHTIAELTKFAISNGLTTLNDH